MPIGAKRFDITRGRMVLRLAHTLRSRLAGFGLAAALALGLLLLSYIRLAGDTMSTAFRNVVHDSVFAGSIWGTALARNLMLFACALVILHLGLALACWLMARLSAYAFPRFNATLNHWVLVWFCASGAVILIANAALYPHTSLGAPYAHLVRAEWAGVSVFMLATGLAMAGAGATAVAALVRRMKEGPRPGARSAIVATAIAAIGAVAAVPDTHSPAPPSDKPHVIIIGIDSLRFDETRPGGPAFAPNVARFLSQSVSFEDAITPLARTFPSWVSILTGRHPHTTGAYINLLPRRMITTGETLGDLFRRAGYRTVYGIDEVRFSNIDESYGFDQIVTPPMGASDFLIGWFGDTPLSNLVVNTRLGALLFRYVHANRGAAKTYEPEEFIERVARELRFDRPTFLTLHLTLAHWPFSWRDSPGELGVKGEHATAVKRVDEQFANLLATLERSGALANALVIVLSDHGEAVGLETDTLLRKEHGLDLFERHKTPHGHGTDVLSPSQYHVVLGMRCFGKCPIELRPGRVIDAPVSLEDLAPTLSDLFALPARDPVDGRSLRPLLESVPGAEQDFRDRIRFTESEFNPVGLMTSGRLSASAAAAAALFYRIDPHTDRIELRDEKLKEILKHRQYAAFDANTLLAALPHPSGAGYELVAVRRDGSEARRLTALPGPDTYPELQDLYGRLSARFSLGRRTTPHGDAE
jgi:arylsulfatase A-like enzyme